METGREGLSLRRRRDKDTVRATEQNSTLTETIKSTDNPPKWPQLVCIPTEEEYDFQMWRRDIWPGPQIRSKHTGDESCGFMSRVQIHFILSLAYSCSLFSDLSRLFCLSVSLLIVMMVTLKWCSGAQWVRGYHVRGWIPTVANTMENKSTHCLLGDTKEQWDVVENILMLSLGRKDRIRLTSVP